MYATEGESRRVSPEEQIQQSASTHSHAGDAQEKASISNHKGHNFIPLVYHLPTNCEVCTKPLWAMPMFKPPPAIECQRECFLTLLSLRSILVAVRALVCIAVMELKIWNGHACLSAIYDCDPPACAQLFLFPRLLQLCVSGRLCVCVSTG